MVERNGARGLLAEEGAAPTLGENYVQVDQHKDV